MKSSWHICSLDDILVSLDYVEIKNMEEKKKKKKKEQVDKQRQKMNLSFAR